MWKQVETDETAVLKNGEEFKPVATLEGDNGGRIQIFIDDWCYVIGLKTSDGTYKMVYHISSETLEVLKNLPSPNKQ